MISQVRNLEISLEAQDAGFPLLGLARGTGGLRQRTRAGIVPSGVEEE